MKEQSAPALAVRLIEKSCALLKSIATEQEFLHVIARPQISKLISPLFVEWARRLLAKAELITIIERITSCRDAKDNKFLELAVNGQADVVVTGDQDLLILNPFHGVVIVQPAAFILNSAVAKWRADPS
ncbi:MAG: putative toxin-antitoxin system toxin component, PIN family [Magnetococcales bacterium]|nr:putative toxin-antitoxin system toxin component, PIN family [Magnetococcales bacterium]